MTVKETEENNHIEILGEVSNDDTNSNSSKLEENTIEEQVISTSEFSHNLNESEIETETRMETESEKQKEESENTTNTKNSIDVISLMMEEQKRKAIENQKIENEYKEMMKKNIKELKIAELRKISVFFNVPLTKKLLSYKKEELYTIIKKYLNV